MGFSDFQPVLTFLAEKFVLVTIYELFLRPNVGFCLMVTVFGLLSLIPGCVALRNRWYLLTNFILTTALVLLLSLGRFAHSTASKPSRYSRVPDNQPETSVYKASDEHMLPTHAYHSAVQSKSTTAASGKGNDNGGDMHATHSNEANNTNGGDEKLSLFDPLRYFSDYSMFEGDWVYSALYALFVLSLLNQTVKCFYERHDDDWHWNTVATANLFFLFAIPVPVELMKWLGFKIEHNTDTISDETELTERIALKSAAETAKLRHSMSNSYTNDSDTDDSGDDVADDSTTIIVPLKTASEGASVSSVWHLKEYLNAVQSIYGFERHTHMHMWVFEPRNGANGYYHRLSADRHSDDASSVEHKSANETDDSVSLLVYIPEYSGTVVHSFEWCLLYTLISMFFVSAALFRYGSLHSSLELIPFVYCFVMQQVHVCRAPEGGYRLVADRLFWSLWFEVRAYVHWLFYTIDAFTFCTISRLYLDGVVEDKEVLRRIHPYHIFYFCAGFSILLLTDVYLIAWWAPWLKTLSRR